MKEIKTGIKINISNDCLLKSNDRHEDNKKLIESFGTFTNINNVNAQSEIKFANKGNENEIAEIKEENSVVQEIMGISGFGKRARQFDLEELVNEIKETIGEKYVKGPENYFWDWENYTTTRNQASEDSSNDNNNIIGPPIPPEYKSKNDTSDDESEEELLPCSQQIILNHGAKPVSAVSVDPAGARLVTGAVDYDVKFWDFAGMDASFQSFRTLQPCECHPIKKLQYSITGDCVLIISGSAQAKVLDRDGFELMECVKGYQFITDMSQTKGHISGLNDGCWHPKDRDEFLTCSQDGTLRLWMYGRSKNQKQVIKPRGANGLKAIPTSCTYSRDGKLVVCGCQDGSIQMWDHDKNFVNTCHLIRQAHEANTTISSVAFSYDGLDLASRSQDHTMKLWDMRMLKQPVHIARNLFNRFDMTSCGFSPDDKIVITGTSLEKNKMSGSLIAFDRSTFNILHQQECHNTDIIHALWHPKLNQLIVGCGDGNVKVYYSCNSSSKGAILCASKTKKKTKQVAVIAPQQIITPHALPLFRQQRPKSTRRQMEKDRQDPIKSRQPELPLQGVGTGGRVAASGSTLSSYIVRNLGLSKKIEDEQDPREAILKYAKIAEECPYWVTPAYAKTQPNPIFKVEEENEDEPILKKKKNKTK